MVKNSALLRKFERELVRQKQPDFAANLRLIEGMYEEAVSFGVFPAMDPLSGIDVDIRIASVINSVPRA